MKKQFAFLVITGVMMMALFGCQSTNQPALTAYSQSDSGGKSGGKTSLKIAVAEEGVYLTETVSERWDDEGTVTEYEVDKAVLSDIEAVFRKYHMEKWDNKTFTKQFVADGKSHAYSFTFADGDNVSFSSQIYPEPYGSQLSEIDAIIDRYRKAESF